MLICLVGCSSSTCVLVGPLACAVASSRTNAVSDTETGTVEGRPSNSAPATFKPLISETGIPQATSAGLIAAVSYYKSKKSYEPNAFEEGEIKELLLDKTGLIQLFVLTEANPIVTYGDHVQRIMYTSPEGRLYLWAPDADEIGVGFWGIHENSLFCTQLTMRRSESDPTSTTMNCSRLAKFKTDLKSQSADDVFGLSNNSTPPFDWKSANRFNSLDEVHEKLSTFD